ncbi:hypothetical protein CPC08DRAFT_754815 [Agrocybe pediades]|nr:hypothetical protein CPC08DRAFT_754815 [Agrocybe pediades]
MSHSHSPTPAPASASTTNGRSRRPLSPSSLRDVDLTQAPDPSHRKYPTPPTGHDLMAMFPPAPPDNFPEMRPGPTSGFFQRQERAFFAQAGKEIVRVRIEVDFPNGIEPEPIKARPTSTGRPWVNGGLPVSTLPQQSPVQSSTVPQLYPHPPSRSQRGSVSVTPVPLYSQLSHTPTSTQPPPIHVPSMLQDTPPGALGSKSEYASEEVDDESWRRPMPYAERRRAGKHTRRVIVRT